RVPVLEGDGRDQAILVQCLLHANGSRSDEALRSLEELDPTLLRTTVAFESRRLAARAYIAWIAGDVRAAEMAQTAARHARDQGALLWAEYARARAAVATRSGDPSRELEQLGRRDPAILS